MDDDSPKNGEVIPPSEVDEPRNWKGELNILALIKNYTNRPDLFLAEVEKNDPGFIKRMNESAASHSDKLSEGKYNFGKRQAYISLILQCIAALTILSVVAYSVVLGMAGFSTIIALSIFFAVTQSGVSGFLGIASAIRGRITRSREKDDSS